MPLLIEETTRVGAPPEAVWRLLSDPQSYRFWWPGCKMAESADRRPLHDGSRLEISLDRGLLGVTYRATVEVAQANRALIWVIPTTGVTMRQAFYLELGANGTNVRERGTFHGWGLPLFRLLRQNVTTAEMFRANLRGLRKLAERS